MYGYADGIVIWSFITLIPNKPQPNRAGIPGVPEDWGIGEKVTEYAKEDAAQNVYMGNKFLALRKNEVAKVALDRATLMGEASQEMADMEKIQEADERWLCILLGEPYEAKCQSEGTGSAVHVYDGNSGKTLRYTADVGWHERSRRRRRKYTGL